MTRIEEMERMYSEATPGEWTDSRHGHFLMSGHECVASFVNCDGDTHANKALVIAMHKHWPALLAVVRAAQSITIRRQPHMNGPGEARVEHGQSDKLIALQQALLPFAGRQG